MAELERGIVLRVGLIAELGRKPGREVPDVHDRTRRVDRGQRPAIGRHGQRRVLHGARAGIAQGLLELAGAGVPDLDDPVGAGGEQPRAVGVVGSVIHDAAVRQREQKAHRPRVPDLGAAVIGGDDLPTVARERRPPHPALDAAEPRHLALQRVSGALEHEPHRRRVAAESHRQGQVDHRLAGLALQQRVAAALDVGLDQVGLGGLLGQVGLQRVVAEHREGDRGRDRDQGDAAADPRGAARQPTTGIDERRLEIGQRDRPVAAQPALEVGQHVVAPQQAARPHAIVPLPRRDPELLADARAVDVLAGPALQPRPRVEQRVVDDLDVRLALDVRHRDQPRGDQLVEHDAGARGGDALAQLLGRQAGARTVGGDQVAEDLARDALLVGGEPIERGLGVADQRPADPAHRVVGAARQLAEPAVAELPQPERGERHQRERPRVIGDRADHVVRELGIRQDVAGALGRLDDDPHQILARGVAEQHQRGRQQRAQRRQRLEVRDEVVADRRDHADRQVGGRRELGERGGEPRALVAARAQREQLLELVDHDDDRAPGRGLGHARRGGHRRGREQGREIGSDDADVGEPRRQRGERCRARPQGHRAPASPQPGQHAGVDERALAGARRTDHDLQRALAQPLEEAVDLDLAADEALGVARGVRREPQVRRAILAPDRRAVVDLGEHVVRDPVPQRRIVVLVARRCGDHPRAVAAAAAELKQLRPGALGRRHDLHERPQIDADPALAVEQHRVVLDQLACVHRRERAALAAPSGPALDRVLARHDEHVVEHEGEPAQRAVELGHQLGEP